ncbi:UNVERIFIED_CONTAM: Pollen receptor-like kinase [Sesamum radiatum]|uniref:Pollen receptor-like kinase n=1 Tax=Sesamum radiatum TaxID=300843 RepID=A0AAW2VRJ7_SESRA
MPINKFKHISHFLIYLPEILTCKSPFSNHSKTIPNRGSRDFPARPFLCITKQRTLISKVNNADGRASCSISCAPTPTSNNYFFFIHVRNYDAIGAAAGVLVVGAEENQSEALTKFKTALVNADPGLADWTPTKPPCLGNVSQWTGILCFSGYVWGLQLENMNLKGQIDVNSLISLRFLRTLSFMNNNFEGTMPDWRKIGALKSLYLSNNQFSGEIPDDAFKGMTSLKKVHLANNKFTGHIPSSLESPKLIELRLENNQFTGTIPAISSDNLKTLNVANNLLEGPIPEPLAKLDPNSFSGAHAT